MEGIVQTCPELLRGLALWPLPWGAQSSDRPPSWWRTFCCSISASPLVWLHSILSLLTRGIGISGSAAPWEEGVTGVRSPLYPLFSKLNKPLLVSLTLKTFHQLGCPPLGTLLTAWCPPYTEGPSAAPVQCRWDRLAVLCSLTPRLTHVELALSSKPQLSFCRAARQPLVPPCLGRTRITHPQCRTWHLLVLHFTQLWVNVKASTQLKLPEVTSQQLSSLELVSTTKYTAFLKTFYLINLSFCS